MRKHPNLILGATLVVLLALGTFQGRLITQERVSQDFYRWIIGAADAVGRDGQLVPAEVAAEFPELEDDRLFDAIASRFEDKLSLDGTESSPVAVSGDAPQPKLVAEVRSLQTDDLIDPMIWKMARGSELADLRGEYEAYRKEDRIYFSGAELGLGDLFGDKAVTASLGSIFFGFRKMAANLLWLQCDSYFHSGEDYLLLPTIRTVVALDPQFVDAYLIGAWHMAYNITAKMEPTAEPEKRYSSRFNAWVGPRETYIYEAIELLKLGIKNNPRNYKIYFDLGYTIYAEKLGDFDTAAKYLKEALQYHHELWAARTYYVILFKNEQFQESKEGWQYFLQNFDPDSNVAERFILYCDAMMAEKKGDAAVKEAEAAKAAGDKAAEMAARAQMKEAYDDSRAVLQHIVDTYGEENFVESRRLLMDAREDILNERYYEALGKLEQARSSGAAEYALPIGDIIIDVKNRAGIPLNLSERMQLERQKDRQRVLDERNAGSEESTGTAAAPVRRTIQWPLLIMSILFIGAGIAAVVVMARSKA